MQQQSQDTEGRTFMTRTENAFSKGKAFIPFITAGDPDIGTTEQLI